MLTLLRLSGFALIDELELPLGPGLTVITGETGAGKSILVDALALLRGGRASAEVIRSGRDDARVEALVELPPGSPARAWLEAQGLSPGLEGPATRGGQEGETGLLLRRLIARNGRGRAHIAGSLATTANLAALVGPLIEIASQHDQQSLTDPESQLAILDGFAENELLKGEMADAFAAKTTAAAAVAAFAADARTRSEREDLLRFQLGELEAARPVAGEDEALAIERERLRGAEKFFGATARGEEVLYSGDGAVSERIASVLRDLEPLAALDPALRPAVESLETAAASIEEAGRDLGRYARSVRADPARLAEVEERLFLLQRLCRKHGGSVAELALRRDQLATELAALGSYEDGLAARHTALEQATARADRAAALLTEARRAAAATLERKVSATLRELGFATGGMPVVVERRELGPSGADRVCFLFAPNPGEPPRPLGKIASGGELSRVMLAVKQAVARTDQVLTHVFDEVDAGVGGGTAEVIGRKLKRLAASRQVIVITHLPQVAAFADAHVRVSKSVVRGKTRVSIERLSDGERVSEIARMLGGAAPTTRAAAHADEMLRSARL